MEIQNVENDENLWRVERPVTLLGYDLCPTKTSWHRFYFFTVFFQGVYMTNITGTGLGHILESYGSIPENSFTSCLYPQTS
jgi:hypothetical protein